MISNLTNQRLSFRKAKGNDFEQMVVLQNQNLATNLSDEQKSDGFLSGSFSAAQFSELNDNLAVIVCVDDEAGTVVGFLCASTAAYNKSFALPAAMVARYPEVTFMNKSLDQWESYISGPVCVDKDHRGSGIFAGLYEELFRVLPSWIEVAVTLVSDQNPRSIRAHEKVGMSVIDNFEYNNRKYIILTRMIR